MSDMFCNINQDFAVPVSLGGKYRFTQGLHTVVLFSQRSICIVFSRSTRTCQLPKSLLLPSGIIHRIQFAASPEMSHQPAANPGAQAGNPVRERPVTIQHHLDKEAPKAKRTATDKLVEKIRPASALFSQEASRNETGKLEVALNKCSLMDMPNEILSNIADQLILSSLSDANNYELDGDDEKPRDQKRLRYI